MAVPPDTFLLIIITCGVCIIVVGMIIAVNCPLKALSCSFYFSHCKKLLRRMCCRKKEKNWKEVIVNHGGKSYGVSLVEGRPQGHGFYTSGPWSSTDTTSTCFSGADTYNINLAAQTGIMGAQYYAMLNSSNGNTENNSSPANNNTSVVGEATVYGNSDDLLSSSNYGLHGDNSNALQLLCGNCNGVGFIDPSYLAFGSSLPNFGNGANPSSSSSGHPDHNGSHSDAGSSTGCLSASADSAMASDMDVDMIICM